MTNRREPPSGTLVPNARELREKPTSGTPVGNLRDPITVVAAIIERDDRFLLTLRAPGTHLAGHWEFPGGKCHPAETHSEALRRELHEELDIVATVGACVFQVTHDYGDRAVSLYFYQCTFEGDPKPMLGQALAWIARGDLPTLPFPEADQALIARLSGSEV